MISKFTKLALVVASLLFSCTSVERDNPHDSGGINYIGDNDIANYKTVQIGEQVWMAENLNYAVRGSKCLSEYGDETDATTAFCYNYGRLYSWATAMKLPDSCNNNSCKSQISEKHKGICPKDWHIPSKADWDKLLRYVDPVSWPYKSKTAGGYLKSTRGWEKACYNGTNGTDDYGFSALFGQGYNSGYLSSSESDRLNAVYLMIECNGNSADDSTINKSNLFSVRCLKD